MLSSFKLLVHSCKPIKIAPYDSRSGARIGGNPPHGVMPQRYSTDTRYFLTLPLEHGFELSIFLTFDADYSMWRNTGVLHDEEDSVVECIVHGPAERSDLSRGASELSSHALVVGEETPEPQDAESARFGHKFGGFPLYHWTRRVDSRIENLGSAGFIHLLQFNFPSSEDAAIEGSWPFGEAIFHLFAREVANVCEFKYIWG